MKLLTLGAIFGLSMPGEVFGLPFTTPNFPSTRFHQTASYMVHVAQYC